LVVAHDRHGTVADGTDVNESPLSQHVEVWAKRHRLRDASEPAQLSLGEGEVLAWNPVLADRYGNELLQRGKICPPYRAAKCIAGGFVRVFHGLSILVCELRATRRGGSSVVRS